MLSRFSNSARFTFVSGLALVGVACGSVPAETLASGGHANAGAASGLAGVGDSSSNGGGGSGGAALAGASSGQSAAGAGSSGSGSGGLGSGGLGSGGGTGGAGGDLTSPIASGSGLDRHPFLYAGEWDTRKPNEQSMFIVRDGKVAWKYSMPLHNADGKIQEFDDATLLANGNIIFSHMSGASMINPAKTIVWSYPAPPGTEVHSCQSLGGDRLLIMRNGNPAQAMIINTATNATEKIIPIPTTVKGTHGQFRHIRMTKQDTIVVPHMSESKVVEYDLEGKELWRVSVNHPWSAVRLKNGNTLITGFNPSYTREVNHAGETVWEFTEADIPGSKMPNTQFSLRMLNGNTVITSWIAGESNTSKWPGSIQAVEVTPDKRVVWTVSSWTDPDLGPATSMQLLDEPDAAEDQQR